MSSSPSLSDARALRTAVGVRRGQSSSSIGPDGVVRWVVYSWTGVVERVSGARRDRVHVSSMQSGRGEGGGPCGRIGAGGALAPNQAGCPHRLWPRWSARRHASCGGRLRCCQSAAPIDGSSCRTGRLREREAEPLDRTVQSAKSGPAGELWESPGHFWAEPIPTADCRGLPC